MFSRKQDNSLRQSGGVEAKKSNASKKDVLGTVLIAIGALLFAAALIVGSFPFLSSLRNAYRADSNFSSAVSATDFYDQEKVQSIISNAEAYNNQLAGQDTEEDVYVYDEQLSYDDANAPICWVDIPSINVKLPVYHDDGTESVPSDAAEHVQGTSLPVGGGSSNCVITAHSGSDRGTSLAFNRLDLLEEGDNIILWTLGEPYAYVVTGLEQVSTDDTEKLEITPGEDSITLLTCRPIGTTAHRLLVHASRTDYIPSMSSDRNVEIMANPDFPFFIGTLVVLGIILWLVLLFALFNKKQVWVAIAASNTLDDLQEILDNKDTQNLDFPQMQIERRRWTRTAKFQMIDETVKGKWSYIDKDTSHIAFKFAEETFNNIVKKNQEQYPDIVMFNASFDTRIEEGYLIVGEDNQTTFIFQRKRKANRRKGNNHA